MRLLSDRFLTGLLDVSHVCQSAYSLLVWGWCHGTAAPLGATCRSVVPWGGEPLRRRSRAGKPSRRCRSRGPVATFRGCAKPEPALVRHASWKGSVGLLRGAGLVSQVHAVTRRFGMIGHWINQRGTD